MSESDGHTVGPLVVGANQRSSSLMIRDRLFLDVGTISGVLRDLRGAGVSEAMVLSTCDRTEVQAIHHNGEAAARAILEVLARYGELSPDELQGQLYILTGEEALRHIFTVTAALDSLVIGEPHVLGQIKASRRIARDAGMTGNALETVLQAAFGVAKRVRRETVVGSFPVSIAAAAVELARGVHGDLDRCTTLMVGTGDLSELLAKAFLSSDLGHLVVTHPQASRADILAQVLNCHVSPFPNLAETLPTADIIVTSMGSRRHVLTRDMIKAVVKARRHRPLLLIDLGIPGDVDPLAERLDDAFLYDLNDLESVAMKGRANREKEAGKALRIVDDEVAAFLRGRAERDAVPTVTALRQHFEAARRAAVADARGRSGEGHPSID